MRNYHTLKRKDSLNITESPYSFGGNYSSRLTLSLTALVPYGSQASDMTHALQSALHLAPLPAHGWETTDDMFKAIDGYLDPATRLA